MSSVVEALLEMLSDGKWHGLAELRQQIGVAAYQMQGLAAFLSRFDFAVVDEANEKVKINGDFQEFLARA